MIYKKVERKKCFLAVTDCVLRQEAAQLGQFRELRLIGGTKLVPINRVCLGLTKTVVEPISNFRQFSNRKKSCRNKH